MLLMITLTFFTQSIKYNPRFRPTLKKAAMMSSHKDPLILCPCLLFKYTDTVFGQ